MWPRGGSVSEPVVWLNGETLTLSKARLNPMDRGYLFGDGVFETLRSERGRVLFLPDHLQRLSASCRALRLRFPPDLRWAEIMDRLIGQNGLREDVARIKILISRGSVAGPGLPEGMQPTTLLYCERYLPPSESDYRRGSMLSIFREGFAPFLASHKSLNYLFFLFARQAAMDRGMNDAVIIDSEGHVAETTTGSLLVRSNGLWWTSGCRHRLPGIGLRKAVALLARDGEAVHFRRAKIQDLLGAQTVWMLNSLIGIMPVARIDGVFFSEPLQDLAAAYRRRLFS
jgi:branched-chain amino acid aminotransferase/para-aminobenzoate synthetase component 1